MQVLEGNDERPLLRQPLQEAAHRPEHLRPRRGRVGRAGRRPKTLQHDSAVVGLGERGPAASRPPSSATSCSSGQKVIPLPYGRQRPVAVAATPWSSENSSRVSRDFPIPAGPRMVTIRHRRSANAASTSDRSVSSSAARPTSGASRRRAYPAAAASTSSSRKRATASLFPFAVNRSRGPTRTASFTSGYVFVPIRIVPGSAACSSRLARFTASPVTNVSPAPGSPATTSPVLIPILHASSAPHRSRSSAFSNASRRCISVAARTARSASSSCVTGTPNTAITSSPRNRSTVPPCAATTSAIDSAYRDITFRVVSGSAASPSDVEPTTSQKRIVTVLRTSSPSRTRSGSAAPHELQKREPSVFELPQLSQTDTARV